MALQCAYGDGFVGTNNPPDREVVYVKGDEFTDGSLRMIPDTEHEGTGIQFELRSDGVWNVTTIDLLGEDSVALGHSVELGLLGDHLRLLEADGDESIVPTRHYSNAAGSADADESIYLQPRQDKITLQPDDSGVITNGGGSGTVSWIQNMSFEKTVDSIWIRPHSTFDTNVEVTIRRDNASGGILMRHKFPASIFIAGADVEMRIAGHFESEDFAEVWIEIAPLISGTIAVKADLTNTFAWTAMTFFFAERTPLMNFRSGVDAIVYEFVTVGTGGNQVDLYQAILTTEGNQITYVPSTTV